MNVRQIVIAHLKSVGADGICSEYCGCGFDDLMDCGESQISKCIPAKKVICKDDGFAFCEFCEAGCSDKEKESAYCYRPIDTPNEPEETHL